MRDRIAVAPGCLHRTMLPDWRPLPDDTSRGHDIETAFLLIEAAEALGRPVEPTTDSMARMLVDHVLAFAWDARRVAVGKRSAATGSRCGSRTAPPGR